jgi:AbrB family looped-hinge helix DNA binding protein
MTAREVVKFRLANGQHMVTIPKSVMRHLSIKEGDRVMVRSVSNVKITVTKERDDESGSRG